MKYLHPGSCRLQLRRYHLSDSAKTVVTGRRGHCEAYGTVLKAPKCPRTTTALLLRIHVSQQQYPHGIDVVSAIRHNRSSTVTAF